MWKPLALAALLALNTFDTPAQARGAVIIGNGERCNAQLKHRVRVGPNFFEVHKRGKGQEILVHYQYPAQLAIGGETLDLDDNQQQLLLDYQRQLHNTGREFLLVALEATDVALNSVSIALTALAGPDHPDSIELQQTSDEILRRVEQRLNREGEIYVLGEPDIGNIVAHSVTDQLEPKIERLATRSAGTIARHALKAAFTGGRSIEHQAEQAATEAAKRAVEERAEQLKQRADSLCQQIEAVDRVEDELHQSIPALAAYDIVSID